MEIDADHWKTWVHQRLSTPVGKAGAMTLFQAPPQEHLALVKHLTAETKTEEFVAGRGVVVKWERLRRQNHWFDALYNACAAGHLCGVRLVSPDQADSPPEERRVGNLFGDSRAMPWVNIELWRRNFDRVARRMR